MADAPSLSYLALTWASSGLQLPPRVLPVASILILCLLPVSSVHVSPFLSSRLLLTQPVPCHLFLKWLILFEDDPGPFHL